MIKSAPVPWLRAGSTVERYLLMFERSVSYLWSVGIRSPYRSDTVAHDEAGHRSVRGPSRFVSVPIAFGESERFGYETELKQPRDTIDPMRESREPIHRLAQWSASGGPERPADTRAVRIVIVVAGLTTGGRR